MRCRFAFKVFRGPEEDKDILRMNVMKMGDDGPCEFVSGICCRMWEFA